MSDAAAKRRARQTVNNLVLSLLATIGLVVVLVLIVPRDNTNHIPAVDAKKIAAAASADFGQEIVLPDLPKGWWSNQARWYGNPADKVPAFKAGFVGPENQYIGLIESFNANPTWLALQLDGTTLTGALPVGYRTWDIYTSKVVHEPAKTMDYIMVMTVNTDDYVLLFGTAKKQDFEYLATSLDAQLMEVRPNE